MNGTLSYCKILGTNINVTDMDKTIDYLFDNLDELRGQYICVSNVHTTVMSYRDPEYQKVQNSGAMALPDGQPLSIVSRRRGYTEARRVPGPDLMPEIIDRGIKAGYRHYFYGSCDETLDKLRKQLILRYPQMQIAGMYAPPFRELTAEEDNEMITKINDTHPDFIWVALGAPKQEKWMYEHREKINGIMLGVGAAFVTKYTIKIVKEDGEEIDVNKMTEEKVEQVKKMVDEKMGKKDSADVTEEVIKEEEEDKEI